MASTYIPLSGDALMESLISLPSQCSGGVCLSLQSKFNDLAVTNYLPFLTGVRMTRDAKDHGQNNIGDDSKMAVCRLGKV